MAPLDAARLRRRLLVAHRHHAAGASGAGERPAPHDQEPRGQLGPARPHAPPRPRRHRRRRRQAQHRRPHGAARDRTGARRHGHHRRRATGARGHPRVAQGGVLCRHGRVQLEDAASHARRDHVRGDRGAGGPREPPARRAATGGSDCSRDRGTGPVQRSGRTRARHRRRCGGALERGADLSDRRGRRRRRAGEHRRHEGRTPRPGRGDDPIGQDGIPQDVPHRPLPRQPPRRPVDRHHRLQGGSGPRGGGPAPARHRPLHEQRHRLVPADRRAAQGRAGAAPGPLPRRRAPRTSTRTGERCSRTRR